MFIPLVNWDHTQGGFPMLDLQSWGDPLVWMLSGHDTEAWLWTIVSNMF